MADSLACRFVDFKDLPPADVSMVDVSRPRREASYPYGTPTLRRKVWRVSTKQFFPSKVFAEGVPYSTRITKFDDRNDFHVKGDAGHDRYVPTLREAVEWASRYLQVKMHGDEVRDHSRYHR